MIRSSNPVASMASVCIFMATCPQNLRGVPQVGGRDSVVGLCGSVIVSDCSNSMRVALGCLLVA